MYNKLICLFILLFIYVYLFQCLFMFVDKIIMSTVRKSLVDYLLRCNSLQMMAQRLRQKVVENAYFQSQTVFERLDRFKKGYLVPDDLAQFMLDNRLYPNQTQLYIIFRQIDKERTGVITVQRFKEAILPKENITLKNSALGRKYYQAGIKLSLDLQYSLGRYFDHKIKEIRELGLIRQDMLQNHIYAVEEAFGLLDPQKLGVIVNQGQIDFFLRNNGKVLHAQELKRIFRVLRFDHSPQVLYQHVQEHLNPLGKGFYSGYNIRISQKKQVEERYLAQRLLLNEQLHKNSYERLMLESELNNLVCSNRRLEQIRRQQDYTYLGLGRY